MWQKALKYSGDKERFDKEQIGVKDWLCYLAGKS